MSEDKKEQEQPIEEKVEKSKEEVQKEEKEVDSSSETDKKEELAKIAQEKKEELTKAAGVAKEETEKALKETADAVKNLKSIKDVAGLPTKAKAVVAGGVVVVIGLFSILFSGGQPFEGVYEEDAAATFYEFPTEKNLSRAFEESIGELKGRKVDFEKELKSKDGVEIHFEKKDGVYSVIAEKEGVEEEFMKIKELDDGRLKMKSKKGKQMVFKELGDDSKTFDIPLKGAWFLDTNKMKSDDRQTTMIVKMLANKAFLDFDKKEYMGEAPKAFFMLPQNDGKIALYAGDGRRVSYQLIEIEKDGGIVIEVVGSKRTPAIYLKKQESK